MKEIKPNFPESFTQLGITEDNFLSNEGIVVNNFGELRKYIAELSCLHPDSILFFRGQHTDHKRPYGKKGNASTFLPSIYRGNPSQYELITKWNKLELATELLVKQLNNHPDINKEEFKFFKKISKMECLATLWCN